MGKSEMIFRIPAKPIRDLIGHRKLRLDEPVVVLTCARSGSTLLRFVLDAHPALACPPETSLVDLCSRMGVFSMLLDGPPAEGGKSALGEPSADAIRSWLSAVFTPYLERRGKTRWCDKSLGSADSAGRFLTLFPKAKFICLYRHAMDVIDSAIEACPFGLSGYGLDPFVAVHPGNSVAAAADYWVCHTRAIAEFEARYPDSCMRIRYEDLVTESGVQAKRLFDFLGEEQVPSLTAAPFMAPHHEQFGPADHKIWDTSGIHDDSVGRGAQVPVGIIPPAVLQIMNSMLSSLGYREVGEGWNTRPLDATVGLPEQHHDGGDRLHAGPAGTGTTGLGSMAAADRSSSLDEVEAMLIPRITARLADEPEMTHHPAGAIQPFTITAVAADGDRSTATMRCWRVDPGAAKVIRHHPQARGIAGGQADEERSCTVVGDAQTWTGVLAGQLSLASSLRRGRLRLSSPRADLGLPPPLYHDPLLSFLTWLLRSGTDTSAEEQQNSAPASGMAQCTRKDPQ